MKVLAVDLETTGLDPARNSIIEFGAVFFDLFDKAYNPKTLHLQIHPHNMVWDAYCLKLHRELIAEILTRVDAGDLLDEGDKPRILQYPHEIEQFLKAWLIQKCDWPNKGKKFEKITGAGKNFGSFDLQFLLWQGGCKDVFRHRSLDPVTIYTSLGDNVPPELKLCKERAGLQPRVAHRALADAWDVVDLLQAKYAQ